MNSKVGTHTFRKFFHFLKSNSRYLGQTQFQPTIEIDSAIFPFVLMKKRKKINLSITLINIIFRDVLQEFLFLFEYHKYRM